MTLELYAALGQVVRIRPQAGIRRAVLDDYGPNRVAYIVPRVRDIVLGGIDEDRNEDIRPDPEATASILRRCANLIPELASLPEEDILAVVCGLRPARPSVRLEREEIRPGNWVVHNYGHGGAGVTLSWGCAAEVVDLVDSYRHQPYSRNGLRRAWPDSQASVQHQRLAGHERRVI